MSATAAFLAEALADPETSWSLGSFGALATFLRGPGEAVRPLPDRRLGLATARGAIALDPAADLRPVAYETGFATGWSHAVALCLPHTACAMNGRTAPAELGPDRDAARIEDREGLLFDLGLGLLAVDCCIRISDRGSAELFRDAAIRGSIRRDPNLLAAIADRFDVVFLTRIGRIEVVRTAPSGRDSAAPGPRFHLHPEILRHGRTHAATAPIPPGWIPCGAVHPPHPARDIAGRSIPFRHDRHAMFQALLVRWGDPELVAIKADSGLDGTRLGRHARSTLRAARAQEALIGRDRAGPFSLHSGSGD